MNWQKSLFVFSLVSKSKLICSVRRARSPPRLLPLHAWNCCFTYLSAARAVKLDISLSRWPNTHATNATAFSSRPTSKVNRWQERFGEKRREEKQTKADRWSWLSQAHNHLPLLVHFWPPFKSIKTEKEPQSSFVSVSPQAALVGCWTTTDAGNPWLHPLKLTCTERRLPVERRQQL